MRRKLIKQDAFDRITNESVTVVGRELTEAQSIVAKALGKDRVRLHSFTDSTVVYETLDNTFVHAGYELNNESITFNNIEELVIDESSRREKMRGALSEMIDSILVDNTPKAEQHFKNYLDMVRWDEVKKEFPFKKKEKGKDKEVELEDGDKKKNFFFGKAKKAGKEIAEAYATSQNILDYVEFMKLGPTLAESISKSDDRGNVTDLRIPTLRERNESLLQRSDWKVANGRIAESRKKVAELVENQDFCKAVATLKRQNKISDAESLEECLDHIVRNFPEVLYATQAELSQIVSEALQVAGVKNYGDQDCDFMAEGILSRAVGAYSEKVAQVLHLASAPKLENKADIYPFFQHIVETFYPALDEKFGLERKVFVDLYESLGTVYKKADRQGDNALKHEAASYLNEIAAILNGNIRPDLEVAEDAATWMSNVIETNLEMGTWVVSNTPHLTLSGDHPEMAKKAAQSYTPSKDFTGSWGDAAPAVGQDNNNYKNGKNAKTMRNDSWGQAGDKAEIFPSLKNPYIPKPFGDYTMKGDKGVDKEATGQHWSTWTSSDVWPNLQNPYVPTEKVKTGGKGYKMKNGKETDLVVDR